MKRALYWLIVLHFLCHILRKIIIPASAQTMYLGLELGSFQWMTFGIIVCRPEIASELGSLLTRYYATDVEDASGCRPARFFISSEKPPSRVPRKNSIIPWADVAHICDIAEKYAFNYINRTNGVA